MSCVRVEAEPGIGDTRVPIWGTSLTGPVYGRMMAHGPSRSPASPASSGSGCCRCSTRVRASAGSSASTCAIRRAGPASSSSTGSTSLGTDLDAVARRRRRGRAPRGGASTRSPDEPLMTRVNVEGTRRVLDAAARVGVRKIVRPSSAAVYGAWANNPVPLTEDAPLRPNPGFLPGDRSTPSANGCSPSGRPTRRPRVTTRLRIAPVVGAGAHHLVRAGRDRAARRSRVRGAAPPVQVVHVDDVAGALALAVEQRPRRRVQRRRRRLARRRGRRRARPRSPRARDARPSSPSACSQVAVDERPRRRAADSRSVPRVSRGSSPNDRLQAPGWKPRHTNEETILLATADAGDAQRRCRRHRRRRRRGRRRGSAPRSA